MQDLKSEIYKTSKPEAVLGVALPVQRERF
jgi:hypothetical protein